MQAITEQQIAELLAIAAGNVSYVSQYSRTTATIDAGYPNNWSSKQFARDYLDTLKEAERKAAYVPPVVPVVKGKRTEPYAGPFPRGKHSHKCAGCETRGQYNAVACYKSQCRRPQLTAMCECCARHFANSPR